MAHYPPGSTYGPRRLRDFELVWVLRGSARWRVAEAATGPGSSHELELAPGQLALAVPGTVDSYQWDAGRPSSHAYVHLDLAGPSRSRVGVLPAWLRGAPMVRPFAGHDPLGALGGYLLDLAAAGGAAERRRSDEVVALLLDLFLSGPFPQAEPTSPVPEALRPALEHVRRAWAAGGSRPVRVAELAAAAGMSSGHFSRRFAGVFGCGPATALELARLARAAHALHRSNLSIADIAHHHGFADAYHFSKRFAAAYQVPPGRFRRRRDLDPHGPLAAHGLLPLAAALAAGEPSPAPPVIRG